MKKTMMMMGRILFWSVMLVLGLLVGIVAVFVQAWRGESFDAAANAASGIED